MAGNGAENLVRLSANGMTKMKACRFSQFASSVVNGLKCWTGFDVYPMLKAHWERKVVSRSLPAPGGFRNNGVNLFFEARTLSSISKTGRDLARKLSLANIPFSLVDTTAPWASRNLISEEESRAIGSMCSQAAPFRKSIILGAQEQKLASSYSMWHEVFYEFEDGISKQRPALFLKTRGACVFSGFCEKAVRSEAPGGFRIAKIRYPFIFPSKELHQERLQIRKRFTVPPHAFAVFFNFSFASSIERKNPEATIAAFAKAFRDDPAAVLVLKTTGGASHASDFEKVCSSLSSFGIAERTVIIDRDLSETEVLSLTGAMDAYISLHRGEGLGLGMLEAMSLGVPVIATAFGGNTEFTKEDTSFLVPFEMAPCPPNSIFASYVSKWAEPNIEAAAKHLSFVRKNPDAARKKAEKGLAFVRDFYSLENFRSDMQAFLALQD